MTLAGGLRLVGWLAHSLCRRGRRGARGCGADGDVGFHAGHARRGGDVCASRAGGGDFPKFLLGKRAGMIHFGRPPALWRDQSSFTMSVSIRLNRKGTKDRPYYKIVAVDSRKRRDGRYIEQLGTYDPLKEGVNYTLDLAGVDKWLAVGAKPSETVNSMIRKARTAAAKG